MKFYGVAFSVTLLLAVAVLTAGTPVEAAYNTFLTGNAVASPVGGCPSYCVCATDENTGREVILDCKLPDGCVEGDNYVDCSAAGGQVYAYKETTPRPSLWRGSYGELEPELQSCVDVKLEQCGFGAYKGFVNRYAVNLGVNPNEFCRGMNCDQCASALWQQMSSRARLAPWIAGTLEQCLGGSIGAPVPLPQPTPRPQPVLTPQPTTPTVPTGSNSNFWARWVN